MDTYAQVLSYAIPFFAILILIEYIASIFLNQRVTTMMDTISSLSSGASNTLKEILGLAVVIVSYGWMVDNLAIFNISSTLFIFICCFVLIDFASYWSHRLNHQVNLFWNRHIIHHSSEEFNLSCALRQSISNIVGIYFFLYIPMALVGIPATVVAIVAPLHLFAQFWYHTRLINKMGFLEKIIVTPSHHRVHHAINPEYIDKNFAAIFIFWDKIFGTFQEELSEVPAVYGVKKPVLTWNPFLINFQHFMLLVRDAWRTQNILDKFKIWFMPTGWRPKDVVLKYPINVIDDIYAYAKYNPDVPTGLKLWSFIQLVLTNLLMYLLLVNFDNVSVIDVILYSAFLASSIFSYTSLMDFSKIAIPAELVKIMIALYVFVTYNSWFEFNFSTIILDWSIGIYLIISLLLTFYFILQSNPSYGWNKQNEVHMQSTQ